MQVCFRLIEQSPDKLDRVLSLSNMWYASYVNSLHANPTLEDWRVSEGALAAAKQLLEAPLVPPQPEDQPEP